MVTLRHNSVINCGRVASGGRHLAMLAAECVATLSSEAVVDPVWLDFVLTQGARSDALLLDDLITTATARIRDLPRTVLGSRIRRGLNP